MPKPKRLTDAQLFDHAVEYARYKAGERTAKTLAEVERDVVCGEMKARKLGEWERDGVKVTMRTSRKVLSLDRARTALSRAVLRRVTKTVIDSPGWAGEVAAGHITETDVAHCQVEEPVAPHIYVNQVGQRKIAA